MSRVTEIQQSDIVEVEQLIRPHIRRTPVVEIRRDDFDLGDIRLTLKLECLQYAGSFKTRGAFTNFLRRSVPASGGNHG
jgi:threonine dehydratase